MFFELFKTFDKYFVKGINIKVNWCFDEDDEDIYDSAEDVDDNDFSSTNDGGYKDLDKMEKVEEGEEEGKDVDEDKDEEDEDEEEVADDWEKQEEEDNWDPDFEEFDLPKSNL